MALRAGHGRKGLRPVSAPHQSKKHSSYRLQIKRQWHFFMYRYSERLVVALIGHSH